MWRLIHWVLEIPVALVLELRVKRTVKFVHVLVWLSVDRTASNGPCEPVRTEVRSGITPSVLVLVACDTSQVVEAATFESCFERHFVANQRFNGVDLLTNAGRDNRIRFSRG